MSKLDVRTCQVEAAYFSPTPNEFSGYANPKIYHTYQRMADWKVDNLNLRDMLIKLFNTNRIETVRVDQTPQVMITLMNGYDWSSPVNGDNVSVRDVAEQATWSYFQSRGF